MSKRFFKIFLVFVLGRTSAQRGLLAGVAVNPFVPVDDKNAFPGTAALNDASAEYEGGPRCTLHNHDFFFFDDAD